MDEMEDETEVSSYISFIAQLPSGASLDVENVSRKLSNIFLKLYGIDRFPDVLLNMLDANSNGRYINLNCNDATYRVFVVDRQLFHIVLLCSLKYMKCLLSSRLAHDSNLRDFLRHALIHIVNFIWIDKSQSLYLVRLLETIVKKREDVLTPRLSHLVLKCMNKVATSPHVSFKHCAHSVSGIVINSLIHCKSNEFTVNLDDLPIRGVQIKDASKLFTKEVLYENSAQIHDHIIKLFCNNVESRKGSAYYETVMNFYRFEDFERQIWPIYREYLVQPEDDGEFYQSLLKYWIPTNVKMYEIDFYNFLKDQNVHFNLKGYALLEMKKRGFHDLDATNEFLNFRKTSSIGLRILSTYTKKTSYPNEPEIKAIQFYLNCYTQWTFTEDILKSFKLFVSQIFFACHIALSKKLDGENFELYQSFFEYITILCRSKISDETCETSAQILKIIWDIAVGSSSDLLIIYKLDRENIYKRGENLYYLHLNETGIWQRIFFDQRLIDRIEHFLGTSSKHCPKLAELVIDRYLTEMSLNKSRDLINLLSETSSTICLLNSEKMRTSGSLVLAQKSLCGEDFSGVIVKLAAIFTKEINRLDVESLFRCVLIIDLLLEMKRHQEVDIIFFVEKSLEFFDHIFENSLHADFHIKTTKVLETFINNIIECLIISRNQWSHFHKKKVLNHLCTIIQKSNMKRPLSLSISVVQHFGVIMENYEEEREIKILLLQETLDSLYITNKKQHTMIRRNPETRLVIHALCLSDDNPQKPYLKWALNYLIDVVTSPSAPDVTVASALHCLEVLISDNSIQQFTIAFIPLIVTNCIRLFNRKSWLVRNADLQLLKSLIERLFGVPLDYCCRYKSAEDLLILFPELSMDFFEVLFVPSLKDDAIIVLQFFSASKIKNNMLMEELLERSLDVFERLFVYFIKNYPNHFGMLAVKSFAALCITESKIVCVLRDITRFIKQNFESLNRNVFASLVILLEELHEHSASKKREIQKTLRILTKFLCKCNCVFFNLLSLKVYDFDHVISEAQVKMTQETNFEMRIWLNNYVIFVLNIADFNVLEKFLNLMLALNVPEYLQIKMLSVLTFRFEKKQHKESSVEIIAKILICKLTSISDSNGYLVYAYSKTILWMFTTCNGICPLGLLSQVRDDYATKNIYKMIVYVLILSNSDERNDQFISNCLDMFLRYSEVGGDDEILFDISTVMMPLFKCSPKDNRYNILKLAFAMLVRLPTCFEICKFVSHLTSARCSTVAVSLNEFLDSCNLCLHLGDESLVAKLLLEFYCHVNELPDEQEESDTFYVFENDYTLSKMYLKKVIRCSLSNLSEMTIK